LSSSLRVVEVSRGGELYPASGLAWWMKKEGKRSLRANSTHSMEIFYFWVFLTEAMEGVEIDG
jgi:hypothetical protein